MSEKNLKSGSGSSRVSLTFAKSPNSIRPYQTDVAFRPFSASRTNFKEKTIHQKSVPSKINDSEFKNRNVKTQKSNANPDNNSSAIFIPFSHHQQSQYSHLTFCSQAPPGSVTHTVVHHKRSAASRLSAPCNIGNSNRIQFLRMLKAIANSSPAILGPPIPPNVQHLQAREKNMIFPVETPINRNVLKLPKSIPKYPAVLRGLGGEQEHALGTTLAGAAWESRVLDVSATFGRTDGKEFSRTSRDCRIGHEPVHREKQREILSGEVYGFAEHAFNNSSKMKFKRLVIQNIDNDQLIPNGRFTSNTEWTHNTKPLVQAQEPTHYVDEKIRLEHLPWKDEDQIRKRAILTAKLQFIRNKNEGTPNLLSFT
ncbi:hypothetical protein HK098_006596 [Nowakowskiella sp. JEL0407]|nr:hypothetical protein HK098_006596 [Nowakowskiella sp. JEL0407]